MTRVALARVVRSAGASGGWLTSTPCASTTRISRASLSISTETSVSSRTPHGLLTACTASAETISCPAPPPDCPSAPGDLQIGALANDADPGDGPMSPALDAVAPAAETPSPPPLSVGRRCGDIVCCWALLAARNSVLSLNAGRVRINAIRWSHAGCRDSSIGDTPPRKAEENRSRIRRRAPRPTRTFSATILRWLSTRRRAFMQSPASSPSFRGLPASTGGSRALGSSPERGPIGTSPFQVNQIEDLGTGILSGKRYFSLIPTELVVLNFFKFYQIKKLRTAI